MNNIFNELKENNFGIKPCVENVKKTCKSVAESEFCRVKINAKAIDAFLHEHDLDKIKKYSKLMENEISFKNEYSELNFHLVLHLFNFGHGYRHPLHFSRNEGAWKTMKKGIERLYSISESNIINADILSSFTREKAFEIFDLKLTDSDEVNKDINNLAFIIKEVANKSGEELKNLGVDDFSEFFYKKINKSGKKLLAEDFVWFLSQNFLAFNDRRNWKNNNILFLKKAQLAVGEIYARLGVKNPEVFEFEDINNLTVACDNVLPCVLRSLNIIEIPNNILNKIDSKIPFDAGEDEAELRACSIYACELILKKCENRFSSKELSDYLWTLGKEPDFRKVQRHAVKNTCFY